MHEPDPIRSPATAEGWRAGELWVLFGITLLAAAVRLFRVEEWSMAPAEVVTWQAVTMPLHGDDGFFASAASGHPLVYLGLRWLLDTGVLPFDGQGHLRLPFVFVGLVSVPLLALAGSLVGSRRTALLAAGLLALHPWHVIASQTAAPPVVALGFALVAVTAGLAAPRRSRWPRLVACLLAAALAIASDRCGLVVVPMLLAGWSVGPWSRSGSRRRVLAVAGLAVVTGLPATLHAAGIWPLARATADVAPWWSFVWSLRVPVLLVALLAPWVCRPAPLVVAAAAWVPVVGVGAAAALGAGIEPGDLLVTLPACVWLAAATASACAARVRAAAAGVPGLVGAGLVASALVTALGVDAVLLGTVYEGHRAPWQRAANLALATHASAADLVVGAGQGAPSLTFYLRPNHWRDPERDNHPGVRVVPLGDDLGGLAPLLARADGSELRIVLRAEELEALERDADAGRLLHTACRLAHVLPCPREHGDGTLYVFESRAAD
jgi:hypothetical protein